ncbi:UDP-N-acetylglucosamine 1-carboxyvinyltransferase [Cerasicoccus maritimus]|uniref:UDP-N-acetylglucosamine 1-carboxyvinyltransferase n=1 Tax=Cerasicoccus maritimus TaxID=490089 RepID=UPI002852C4AE|nr:UDP-N-acetylglucosamine 1-carboxyvinyltransferase [Cerasicoccus maritimus]
MDVNKQINLSVIGGQIPQGSVSVSGAKNAATRLLAAALLTNEDVVLSNFPTELLDVLHKARFMRAIGCQVQFNSTRNTVKVNAGGLVDEPPMDYDLPIRTTYLLPVGQLVRFGRSRIPYPGGCKLGERKYDLHIEVWRRLGCEVVEHEDHIEIIAGPRGLVGSEIIFPITTVGGTENALLCGAVASGVTILRNAYVTPEIRNLIELLCLMGAAIHVEGNSQIVIQGIGGCLRGATVKVISDRIEALTWIIYAALSSGSVTVENVPFEDMSMPLLHLQESGVDFFRNNSSVYVSPLCFARSSLQPFELACGTHPGIISDMQPFYVLLAMKAAGRSLIVDYRYPKRVSYLEQLSLLGSSGLDWSVGDSAMIRVAGPVRLIGAEVNSTDLRGSMALVMAALLAEGRSVVRDVGMALRGYNQMELKLRALGIEFDLV